jgi:hypothetical protein
MAGIAATNLTNVNVSDTFYGVLHAGGQSIPATGQSQIYDGYGNPTALKLGANCNGATICGPLSASSLSATSLSLTTPILSSILPNVTPSVTGTYSGYLTAINVNVKGLVTSVSTTPTLPLPYKAYALANLNIPYNETTDQGTNFVVVGQNIQSVLWVKKGLYRVTFTQPMNNTNYAVFLQNVMNTLSGEYQSQADPGESTLILGFRGTSFFEFTCWEEDTNKVINLQAFNALVI